MCRVLGEEMSGRNLYQTTNQFDLVLQTSVFSSKLWNCLQFFPLSNLLLNTTDTVMNWLWQDPTSWLKSNHQLMLGGYLFATLYMIFRQSNGGEKMLSMQRFGKSSMYMLWCVHFLREFRTSFHSTTILSAFSMTRDIFYNVYLDYFFTPKKFHPRWLLSIIHG